MRLITLAVIGLLALPCSLAAQLPESRPIPKVVTLDPAATGHTPVLEGPPASVTMESGQVVLAPGASVGRHNTERYEEVVVVLDGTGEMRVIGGVTLALHRGAVAYCPPATEHDVVNTGTTPLRYLYVAARTQ